MSYIDITVVRGDGGVFGEEIVDRLLEHEGVAVARGRSLIDANAKASVAYLNTRYRAGLEVGQTVRVLDAVLGEAWYGKITSVALSVEGVDVSADLEIERPE